MKALPFDIFSKISQFSSGWLNFTPAAEVVAEEAPAAEEPVAAA